MKKHLIWTVSGSCLALVALIAGASVMQRNSAADMAQAARNFIASLDDAQKAKAVFPFDADVRFDWHYIPKPARKGLPFKEMNSDQVHFAHTLLNASLSSHGFYKATTVMGMEILVKQNDIKFGRTNGMSQLRDPNLYYVSIFGEPSSKGLWGWSIEGHHVSQNFTIKDGKLISSTPSFFGSEPHNVLDGPHKGLRVLGAEEDDARALLTSLDEGQLKQALIGDKAPPDIFTTNQRKVEFESPAKGVPSSAMNAKQKEMLQVIIDEYISNLPPDMADLRRAKFDKSDKNAIHFAWQGSMKQGDGQGYYYRVQGTTFLIEFDNIQNNANHSHTVWRDYDGDFGMDVLAEHYKQDHAPKK